MPKKEEKSPEEDDIELGDGVDLGDGELFDPMPEPEPPRDYTPATLAQVERRKLPLGSLLVEAGCINNDQLEMALAEQKRTRKLLGEVLVSLGFATEETIAEAISRQTGIEYLRVPAEPIAPNILKLVPEELCRRYRMVPLGIEGSILKIAMANPFDVVALDTIRASTGLEPLPFIAPWGDIAAAIEKSFSTAESYDGTFDILAASAEARASQDDEGEQKAAGHEPLIEIVNQLILRAVNERATHLHIEPEENVVRVRFRVDSEMRIGPMIPKKLGTAVATRLKLMAGLDISENRRPQDGRIHLSVKGREIVLRLTTTLANFGENIVVRVLDRANALRPLEKMGLFPDDHGKLKRALGRKSGLILVTGPANSGKTTLLYALLAKLNDIDVNVMTVEDPIECVLTLARQTAVDHRAGITCADGLRAILRQNPDIIMIGELGDAETAQLATRAAAAGRLVLSTMPVGAAADAVPRLIGMGVDPLLLSDALIAVTSQRLARAICPRCYKRVPAPEEYMAELEAAAEKENIGWDGMVAEPVGCHDCDFRGLHECVPLFEIFEVTPGAQNLIARKCDKAELAACAESSGMRTLYQDGLRRVLTHKITPETLDWITNRSPRQK